MSVPNDSEYDPAGHLSVSDIVVDNPRELSMVRIRIKQSKTDPFAGGSPCSWGGHPLICAPWLH